MAIKDILLALKSHPEPTKSDTIEHAVSIASAIGSHIAAIACEMHVEVPSSLIASSLVNVPAIIAEESRRSLTNAKALLATFEASAARQGVMFELIRERALTSEVPALFVEYARLRDLTIVPILEDDDRWSAEAIIFGSGKPTLVLPEGAPSRQFQLGTIVVAWDFSRTAARAVADAIPLLEKAKHVRVVTITGERTSTPSAPPKSWPRTFPGTASRSSWTRLRRKDVQSATYSNPMSNPAMPICW